MNNARYLKLNTLIEQSGKQSLLDEVAPFISPLLVNSNPLLFFAQSHPAKGNLFGIKPKKVKQTVATDNMDMDMDSNTFQQRSLSSGTTTNINSPLIGTFNINTNNINGSYGKIKQEILDVLLEVFSRAAPAS